MNQLIFSFIQAISLEPLQVYYYSEALLTQHRSLHPSINPLHPSINPSIHPLIHSENTHSSMMEPTNPHTSEPTHISIHPSNPSTHQFIHPSIHSTTCSLALTA